MKILPAALAATRAIGAPSDSDCCVWARSVLEHAYGSEAIRRVPLARWHMWADRPEVGPWEPVLAAMDAGIGTRVETPTVGRWHICQGWRGSVERWPLPASSGTTGHTWLYLAVDERGGLVLDSTRGRGPGSDLTEWADVVRPFAGGVALAALARPDSVEARGRCGNRGCELAAGHDGLHFAPHKIDPW